MAGATRKDIEGKLGKSVVSSDNYLETPEKIKRIEDERREGFLTQKGKGRGAHYEKYK